MSNRLKTRIRAFGNTVVLGSVFALSLICPHAGAATNTVNILNATVKALPSCLRYDVKGVCVFLSCSWFGCWISTSIRVSHFVPDVIVSTYNDPGQHPWAELGAPIATALGQVGGAIVGNVLDASANIARKNQEEMTFKSVDVIGNPVGMLASMLAGNVPSLPSAFSVPGYSELQAFPSQELPNITNQWAALPAQTGNFALDAARQAALAPSQLVNKISQLPSQVANISTQFGQVGQVLGGSMNSSNIGASIGQVAGLNLGPLQQVGQLISFSGGSMICPGSASAFTLHFQSDLDAIFWRGIIPVELLYPGSWFAGSSDVSQSNPLISTWGGRYPRTGEIVQHDPVKASAVLAERAASIVKRPAQPHIYRRLTSNNNGQLVFESQGEPNWQMVYPKESGCMQFGQNDAVSVSSFGDGQTSSEAGYIWNLWHRYDCCSRAGMWFLFTIP